MLDFDVVEYHRKIFGKIELDAAFACGRNRAVFKGDFTLGRIDSAADADITGARGGETAVFVGDRNRFAGVVQVAEEVDGRVAVVAGKNAVFDYAVDQFVVRMVRFKVDTGERRNAAGLFKDAISDIEAVDRNHGKSLPSLFGDEKIFQSDVPAGNALFFAAGNAITHIDAVAAGTLKFQIFDHNIFASGDTEDMTVFGLAVNFFVEVVVFVENGHIFAADDLSIVDAAGNENGICSIMKSVFSCPDDDVIFDEYRLIAPQEQRIYDPVASGIVDNDLFVAGIQRRLDIFSCIHFVKAETF